MSPKRQSKEAVKAWCKSKGMKLTSTPRHIHPRAYVVGTAAPLMLIVAEPWMDAEPQVRGFKRKHPIQSVSVFDSTLKAGDWCITAYVCCGPNQQTVAVPWPE